MKHLAIISAFILFSFTAFAQKDKKGADKNLKEPDPNAMRSYYMVILLKGDKRNQDSVTAAKIQKAHLDNIGKLAKEGKLVLAGPFMEKDRNERGIFILDAKTKEEAESYLQTDEAVTSGRLKYEILKWYGPEILKYTADKYWR